MISHAFTVIRGDSPIVATAIHDGHAVRPEVARHLALSEPQRLREEDPYTGEWTRIAPNQVIVHRSRFEVDLNRPRDGSVYLEPADAWGLNVWSSALPGAELEQSLAQYDAFYRQMFSLLNALRERHGRFVVLDLHTYNHRREGAEGPAASTSDNPDINLGTGTMDRRRWEPLVDRFLHDLRSFDYPGRTLDARENVRFRGGFFPRWIHATFPDSGCALAVEVKKFFMDEWTGALDSERHAWVRDALASTLPGLLEALATCPTTSSRYPRNSNG